MANLPEAWTEDARTLNNSEQMLGFARGILEETAVIRDFLRDDTNKRIIVAPKGFGKTFLLKSKRIYLQQITEPPICVPENQMVDTTTSNPPSLALKDLQRFVDYAYWYQIWTASIMISAVKTASKYSYSEVNVNDFSSAAVKRLLSYPYTVSPFEALKMLISSGRNFHDLHRGDNMLLLTSLFKQIRRPMAIFIDTIDEFFEGYIDKGYALDESGNFTFKNKNTRVWIVGQLGICRAVRELLGINSHVKVYVSIRKEAFHSLPYYDSNAANVVALSANISYSKEELIEMFGKNIEFMRREDLVEPNNKIQLERFIGRRNIQIENSFTKKNEDMYQFIIRHTLYRPRDLMIMGRNIAKLPIESRTPERIREAVYAGAKEIVQHYLSEMQGLADIPHKYIYQLITKNVLTETDLNKILNEYTARVKSKKENNTAAKDPFYALCRLGLLGVVRRKSYQDVQIFRQPNEVERPGEQTCLSKEKLYIIHPILDGIIATARSDYLRSFHSVNIIGHGLRWHDGKIFKCVLVGDIKSVSLVLNKVLVGEKFLGYLQRKIASMKNEVEQIKLERGDTVTIVDDSADRVISVAQSLQIAVQEFETPQSFRFGGAVGPAELSSETMFDGQDKNFSIAQAVREASRLEPHATPGTILCTESFMYETDEIRRSNFKIVTSLPGVFFQNDNTAVIRKNAGDEPFASKLYSLTIAHTGNL